MTRANGGFKRENRALPRWRIQNNQELLHLQIAQHRKNYSLWLQRQSMNEDIRKTLFMSKVDSFLSLKIDIGESISQQGPRRNPRKTNHIS